MVDDMNPALCDWSTAQGMTITPVFFTQSSSCTVSSFSPDISVQIINTMWIMDVSVWQPDWEAEKEKLYLDCYNKC